MKEALKIDLTGFIIEVELVSDDFPDIQLIYETNPNNPEEMIQTGALITKRVTPGTYKPKWDYINGDWTEGLTQEELDVIKPPITLNDIKKAKIKELTIAKDKELLAGFSSNATGTILYFGYDTKDQEYLHKKATMVTIDPAITSIDWKTRDGFVNLTKEQFIQVVKAGDAHEESLVYKLLYAEANVMNCSSKQEVDAIVW